MSSSTNEVPSCYGFYYSNKADQSLGSCGDECPFRISCYAETHKDNPSVPSHLKHPEPSPMASNGSDSNNGDPDMVSIKKTLDQLQAERTLPFASVERICLDFIEKLSDAALRTPGLFSPELSKHVVDGLDELKDRFKSMLDTMVTLREMNDKDPAPMGVGLVTAQTEVFRQVLKPTLGPLYIGAIGMLDNINEMERTAKEYEETIKSN